MPLALIRIPVFTVGVCFCLLILPFEYSLMAVRGIVVHVFVATTRLAAAPFVIFVSALLDRELWLRYEWRWREAHRRVSIEWLRPVHRIREISLWLPRRGGSQSVVIPLLSAETRSIARAGEQVPPAIHVIPSRASSTAA